MHLTKKKRKDTALRRHVRILPCSHDLNDCTPQTTGSIKREQSVASYRDVVVIVACDNSRLRQKALDELSEMPGISKAIAFAPSKEASRGKTGMFYAVMDLFLLSQSDVILRAGKMTSMFTTLAAGLMIRGFSQPVYMAPVVTPTFYQCDTSERACGVSLSRDTPKLGIMESVITNHGNDRLGTCFGGAFNVSKVLRERRVLYPNCEELLSVDPTAFAAAIDGPFDDAIADNADYLDNADTQSGILGMLWKLFYL